MARQGRLPDGADESVSEAGGNALVCGTDPGAAAGALPSARRVWTVTTGTAPGRVARLLQGALADVRLVILPASPDGRDLAPRLSAVLERPLIPAAVSCCWDGGHVRAQVLRVEGQVTVPVVSAGPAVATLLAGARHQLPVDAPAEVTPLEPEVELTGPVADADFLGEIEPDPATMELAVAKRVMAGGAGLVDRNSSDGDIRAVFALLAQVAAALGASAGATRVITDAGWMGYDRQIGTTGVTVDPDLYLALGVSGASQHIGGLGSPRLTVSVNTDPSCPMTSMADLGLIADGPSLLRELARRLGLPIPDQPTEAGS